MNTPADEHKIKEKLLGKAPSGSTGKLHVPDTDILNDKLENPDSLIHAFCENCGSYSELTKDDIIQVSRQESFVTEIDPAELDPNVQYIHKDGCTICRNEYSLYEVRKIPGK